MTALGTPTPAAAVPPAVPEERGPAFTVLLAILCLAAPGIFDSFTIFALPGALGMHLAKTIEGSCLGLLLFWMLRHRWFPSVNLPMVLALIYLTHAFVSVMWVEDTADFYYPAKRMFRGAVAGFVCYAAIHTRRDLEHLLVALKGLSFISAIMIMIEIHIPGWQLAKVLGRGRELAPMIQPMIQYDFVSSSSFLRARGPQGHPNYLGFYYGITLMLTPYLWERYRSNKARFWIAATLMLELYALILGYVRLGVLGLMVGGAWYVFGGGVKHRMLAVGGILVAAICAYPFLPAGFVTRVTEVDEWMESDRSVERRLSQQFESIDLALQYGGFGIGFGQYGIYFYREADGPSVEPYHMMSSFVGEKFKTSAIGAHNSFLEVLVEQGILGTLAFGGVFLTLFMGLLSSRTRNRGDPALQRLAICFESMVLSACVMMGLLHVQEQRILWVMVGLGSAYLSLTRHGLMLPAKLSAGPSEVESRVNEPLRLGLLALFFGLIAVLVTWLAMT
ncbi:MAG: O-antigen ligase family protein [Planctomycetota bacterium]